VFMSHQIWHVLPIISANTGLISNFSGLTDVGADNQSDICFAKAQGTMPW